MSDTTMNVLRTLCLAIVGAGGLSIAGLFFIPRNNKRAIVTKVITGVFLTGIGIWLGSLLSIEPIRLFAVWGIMIIVFTAILALDRANTENIEPPSVKTGRVLPPNQGGRAGYRPEDPIDQG